MSDFRAPNVDQLPTLLLRPTALPYYAPGDGWQYARTKAQGAWGFVHGSLPGAVVIVTDEGRPWVLFNNPDGGLVNKAWAITPNPEDPSSFFSISYKAENLVNGKWLHARKRNGQALLSRRYAYQDADRTKPVDLFPAMPAKLWAAIKARASNADSVSDPITYATREFNGVPWSTGAAIFGVAMLVSWHIADTWWMASLLALAITYLVLQVLIAVDYARWWVSNVPILGGLFS